MEGQCLTCSRTTKYTCLQCSKHVCNVCSTLDEKHSNYNEDNKSIAICKHCSEKDIEFIEIKKPAEKKMNANKKKQTTLSHLFKNGTRKRPLEETNTLIKEPSSSKSKQTKQRTVTIETIEKSWYDNVLAKYDARDWLRYEKKGTQAINLKCIVCSEYKNELSLLKGFKDEWIKGTTNYRSSNAVDHAMCDQHKTAMKKHFKAKGASFVDINEKLRVEGQQNIVDGLANMSEAEEKMITQRMEVAYFVAKEELPFAKYERLLALEEKQGLREGNAYRNRTACSEMVDTIGETMAKDIAKEINSVNFFSVLCDGSNDASMKEKEVSFVQYFNPKPADSNEVSVEQQFLGLNDLKHSHAEGVKESILQALKSSGIIFVFLLILLRC